MSDAPRNKNENAPQDSLTNVAKQQAARKLKARSRKRRSAWFGLGMFGLVGWAIAIPTLFGAGLGIWIDSQWHGGRSWTLALLIAGLVLGCVNAWIWISKESHHDD
jgi:ATP synthase protein I